MNTKNFHFKHLSGISTMRKNLILNHWRQIVLKDTRANNLSTVKRLVKERIIPTIFFTDKALLIKKLNVNLQNV